MNRIDVLLVEEVVRLLRMYRDDLLDPLPPSERDERIGLIESVISIIEVSLKKAKGDHGPH